MAHNQHVRETCVRIGETFGRSLLAVAEQFKTVLDTGATLPVEKQEYVMHVLVGLMHVVKDSPLAEGMVKHLESNGLSVEALEDLDKKLQAVKS